MKRQNNSFVQPLFFTIAAYCILLGVVALIAQCSKSPAEKKVMELRKAALTSVLLYTSLADSFARLGEPAVPALVKVIRSKQTNESLAALEALKKIGSRSEIVFRCAIKGILHDQPELGQLLVPFGERAVSELRELLKEKKSSSVSVDILRAFGHIGPGAAPAVQEIASFISSQGYQTGYAAEALAKIGPAAHDALPVLLKSTPDCLSSCPTGEVFAAIGAIDSAGATIPQLIPFIKKRCPGVFTTLCIMGSRKHDMALLDTLLKNLPHDDGEVAKLALYGKDVIPLLYPALQGQAPDNGPRISEALTILQALGPESAPAIPRLIVLLKKVIKDDESDSYTAVKIVELLGTIGEAAAPACPVLADLLVEGDGGLWNTMQMDLIVNPSGINIEGAKRMRAAPGPLDESDPSGGPTIAELGEAIEKLDRTDLGRFISIMKGEDITLATKTALDSIGEKAVPHIQPLFKHKRWDVRWQAADVVREIGPSAVLMCVPALTTLAADPYSFVRWRAVQALQKLDPLPENVKRVLARRIDVESDEELADTLRNIIQGR